MGGISNDDKGLSRKMEVKSHASLGLNSCEIEGRVGDGDRPNGHRSSGLDCGRYWLDCFVSNEDRNNKRKKIVPFFF